MDARVAVQLRKERVEVTSREPPLEGPSNSLVVVLEAQESVFDFRERAEVVRGEGFALDHGEVDLDLVEPTGVASRAA